MLAFVCPMFHPKHTATSSGSHPSLSPETPETPQNSLKLTFGCPLPETPKVLPPYGGQGRFGCLGEKDGR